jgi:iron complex transport system ATP-binding protein
VIVEARGITFSYGGDPVVCDVPLGADRGEFLGVFGPNGSGKTTLLRCLSGALRPQQGSVWLEGRPIASYSPRERARRIAVVPQDLPADLSFSALDVALFGRYPHLGFWADEGERDLAIAQAAMECTGAWPLRSRRFDELSGGERQRVTIAKALAQEPSILLLDEPAVHLDLAHQIELYELLGRLATDQRLCIIMVCHDLFLAPAYLGRAVLLHGGVCVGEGIPREALTRSALSKVFGVARLPRLDAALPDLWA